MDQAMQDRAGQIFEEALAQTGAKDPREFYRKRLRGMKADNPEAYDEAVAYYENDLVPSIAEAGDDPLTAWQRFGCRVAELTIAGTPLEVDATGRRLPYAPPTTYRSNGAPRPPRHEGSCTRRGAPAGTIRRAVGYL